LSSTYQIQLKKNNYFHLFPPFLWGGWENQKRKEGKKTQRDPSSSALPPPSLYVPPTPLPSRPPPPPIPPPPPLPASPHKEVSPASNFDLFRGGRCFPPPVYTRCPFSSFFPSLKPESPEHSLFRLFWLESSESTLFRPSDLGVFVRISSRLPIVGGFSVRSPVSRSTAF